MKGFSKRLLSVCVLLQLIAYTVFMYFSPLLVYFNPLYVINDSIRDISCYIIAVSNFIKFLIEQNKVNTPFQCDLIIAVKVLYTFENK